jgi:hypothetical protein
MILGDRIGAVTSAIAVTDFIRVCFREIVMTTFFVLGASIDGLEGVLIVSSMHTWAS